MGVTPRFGLPFPDDGDAPDGPAQLEALALAIEALLTPAGAILATAASAAPAGYLLCDGSAVSRSTYDDLYAAIGDAYHTTADGSHFNLPDLRGRTPVGVDGAAGRLGSNDALGSSAGAESVALTAAQMPKHVHPPGGALTQGFWGTVPGSGSFQVNLGGSHGMAEPTTTNEAGGDQGHNNMQPYQVVNFLIKT